MSKLVILDVEKIIDLKHRAESHFIDYKENMAIYNGKAKIVGDRPEHVLFLDPGFKFVYSIEEIPSTDFKKLYTLKKLSGSINNGNYPSIDLMKIMLEYLGMSELSKCNVSIKHQDTIPNIEIVDIIKEMTIDQ
ncbi:divergent P-loop NTPase [Cotonvirus japonicus]|uniref:Divergent P-loop NTPase n=1 Tax=Cotonvirus japonicus TaxID=2811091 RepID=A0ABM7NRU0_9VIRU|nr:divergent P-loop NTPase [Cotonvirus japonicus]BCS82807.1 divergent P-loop NTPase [Cotonvirus japonicus]